MAGWVSPPDRPAPRCVGTHSKDACTMSGIQSAGKCARATWVGSSGKLRQTRGFQAVVLLKLIEREVNGILADDLPLDARRSLSNHVERLRGFGVEIRTELVEIGGTWRARYTLREPVRLIESTTP